MGWGQGIASDDGLLAGSVQRKHRAVHQGQGVLGMTEEETFSQQNPLPKSVNDMNRHAHSWKQALNSSLRCFLVLSLNIPKTDSVLTYMLEKINCIYIVVNHSIN